MTRAWIAIAAVLAVSACAGRPDPAPVRTAPKAAQVPAPDPKPDDELARAPLPDPAIVRPNRPLQCVPYARKVSGIQIRGDAWTWWDRAHGDYARGRAPREGAVLVLDTGHRRGHIAVVKRVAGPRRIVVDHANWLNRGRIHTNTPVVDVSAANDWSRVRVWYTPGQQLGASPYEVVGFIYPERMTAGN